MNLWQASLEDYRRAGGLLGSKALKRYNINYQEGPAGTNATYDVITVTSAEWLILKFAFNPFPLTPFSSVHYSVQWIMECYILGLSNDKKKWPFEAIKNNWGNKFHQSTSFSVFSWPVKLVRQHRPTVIYGAV